MRKTKSSRLLDLKLQIQACIRCKYYKTRDHAFIGSGEYRSPILLIGSKPRKRDDDDGLVFAGRAEKKLTKMLASAELDIDKVYRTYLVRCYPGRESELGEFTAFKRCETYTNDLIKIMRPTAIVVCGYKAFKWLILRWTREVVDENSFYKWVGKAVRLKERWGDQKFFIIESPAALSSSRNPELEKKSIEHLVQMKSYVMAQQSGVPLALTMTDLKRRPRNKSIQQTFGWS